MSLLQSIFTFFFSSFLSPPFDFFYAWDSFWPCRLNVAIGQELLSGLGVTICDKRKSGQRRWLHLGWSLIRCDFFFPSSFFLIPPFPFLHLRYMILDAKKNTCYFPWYMLFFLFFSFKLAWFFEWAGKKNYTFSSRTLSTHLSRLVKAKTQKRKKKKFFGGYFVFLWLGSAAFLLEHWETLQIPLQHDFNMASTFDILIMLLPLLLFSFLPLPLVVFSFC
ncbi:hypothetical protein GGI43DRAFT_178573 [Trichoderma evansii]